MIRGDNIDVYYRTADRKIVIQMTYDFEYFLPKIKADLDGIISINSNTGQSSDELYAEPTSVQNVSDFMNSFGLDRGSVKVRYNKLYDIFKRWLKIAGNNEVSRPLFQRTLIKVFNVSFEEDKHRNKFAYLNKKLQKDDISDILKTLSPKKTYLITNGVNNLTKIGRSVDPNIRETTLQHEEPTVKLKATLDIDIENILHKEFSEFRVRGEWFDLSNEQIDYIINKYKFNVTTL